ncbi:MAG TPA: hypothetical protein VF771_07030 [Longimicrobiaceae bacterium]
MSTATIARTPLDTRTSASAIEPSPAGTRRRALRGAAAVFTGLVVLAALSTITDVVLSAVHLYPPFGTPLRNPALYLLALAYRAAYSVFGCWLAARLAPAAPMRHAIILGAIGVVLSTAGVIVNVQSHLGPNWYPIALVVIALPCAWLGGALHRARRD